MESSFGNAFGCIPRCIRGPPIADFDLEHVHAAQGGATQPTATRIPRTVPFTVTMVGRVFVVMLDLNVPTHQRRRVMHMDSEHNGENAGDGETYRDTEQRNSGSGKSR